MDNNIELPGQRIFLYLDTPRSGDMSVFAETGCLTDGESKFQIDVCVCVCVCAYVRVIF